jgi:signal transduction histidine kinase
MASAACYGLARACLAPIEAMRLRAAEISMSGFAAGLPLPPARDEVRRLGETLNGMLARIREAFERERRFVADASHELRTPLAVMQTELDGALLMGRAEPEVRLARSQSDRSAAGLLDSPTICLSSPDWTTDGCRCGPQRSGWPHCWRWSGTSTRI